MSDETSEPQPQDESPEPPLKYPVRKPSQEVQDHYIEACLQGMSRVQAAGVIGVTPGLVRRWMANWPEFKERSDLARKQGKLALLKSIRKAGDKDWRANTWLLSNCYPQEFGKLDRFSLDDVKMIIRRISDRLQAKLSDIPQAVELIREAIMEGMESAE